MKGVEGRGGGVQKEVVVVVRERRGAGLALFISPSGVQDGVTQCDGCSPDPQTPADTFNGHRFLSRQRERKGGRGLRVVEVAVWDRV